MAKPRSDHAHNVILTTDPLALTDVVAVARRGTKLSLGKAAAAAMKQSRKVIEDCLDDGTPHYGINTGFGSLAKQQIGAADLATLQRNLVRSHSAGVGQNLPNDVVRAMMVCLAGSLARGFSGVRVELAQTLIDMLNADITPCVPEVGSVGASGDLAPLAHVALALMGEGSCEVRGQVMLSSSALAKSRIKPLSLHAKEGLALINGTHLMAGRGALLVMDFDRLLQAATMALAMSIDACRASHSFLDPRLYEARNHLLCSVVAEDLRDLLAGGTIAQSHVHNDPRVQDPYSLRAAPTVLGAAAKTFLDVRSSIVHELGAVTDNPLVFAKGRKIETSFGTFQSPSTDIISGANFHGMPVAMSLDCLAIPIAHIAGISERRSYLMTGAFEPESHLKPFLAPKPGLQSGLMIAQYAAAACVNEIVGLSMPASVINISTCAGMEDYNSFGPRSAAKAARAIELARHVIAIEMIIACAGLDLHRPLKSGNKVEAARAQIRKLVKPMGEDRVLTSDIKAVADAIANWPLSQH